MFKVIGLALLLFLVGCNNQTFIKKQTQSQDQFKADKAYCKSEALGNWDNTQGVSQMNLRSQKVGRLSYEECMLEMGYIAESK